MTPVSDAQRAALRVMGRVLPSEAYLAGGVALAARLGHRQSRDLDWFVPDMDPSSLVDIAASAGARIVSRAVGTLYLEVEGVPVSVIRYGYPLLQPVEEIDDLGIRAASLQDLACMKLSAIAGRGKARDFWDLHEMMVHSRESLDRLLESYERKYRQEDVGHVVRSLVYFADADAEPLPEGLTPEHWSEIKSDLRTRVLAVSR
jgi:hypothetical protein